MAAPGLQDFLGTHDFTQFSNNSGAEPWARPDPVRTLGRARLANTPPTAAVRMLAPRVHPPPAAVLHQLQTIATMRRHAPACSSVSGARSRERPDMQMSTRPRAAATTAVTPHYPAEFTRASSCMMSLVTQGVW